MSVLKNIIDFSSDGEYLAYSSPDGCLKIWETSTNFLKQEYTPSSHLSATCATLSWCPNIRRNPSKRHKKLKDDRTFSTIRDLQLIAMGTLTGDILLYSCVKADLYSHLSNGHTSIVNDLCWCVSTCSLYSCSNDKNIVVWDIFTGDVKTTWKADDLPVQSLCLIDSGNLLSASHSIKWWNINQKTVIKTFTGHAMDVIRLLPLNIGEKAESSFILSAAVGDKFIKAWQLNENSSETSIASFQVSNEPENISVFTEKDGPTYMSVVCKDGSLHLFEYVLDGGKRSLPISSKFCVKIASKSSESGSKPQQIPALCANLSLGLNSSLLSYGSFLNPVFEKIDLSDVSADLFLVRNLSFSSAAQEDGVTRIKHTNRSDAVKVLIPGHLIPVKGSQSIPRKRKKKGEDEKELPIEVRLKALDLSKIPPNFEDQEPALKVDSMVHLLLQGLQSKDNNLINTVLQSSDEKIIQNTLKRLPLQSIISLLKELQDRLNRKEQRNHPYLKWMKGLLSVHLPYLMSCKDIVDYLGPINSLIAARIENFPKMCKLQGSLKILLSQTSSGNLNNVETDQPLAVYQSDSSDENDDEDHSDNSSDAKPQHEVSFEDYSLSESASEDDMDL